MKITEKLNQIIKNYKDWRYAVYAMQSFDSIAGGLIGIFMVIYFLTLGYSVSQIFIFYIINNFSILVLFFIAGFFSKRFGLARTLSVRLIFLFLSLFLLYNLDKHQAFFYWISVLSAAELAFYWFPLHVIFAKNSKKELMGSHVSKLFAIPKFIKLFVPILGSVITYYFGFKALFVFAGGVYAITVIPFLFVEKIPAEVSINFERIIDYARRHKKYFLTEMFLTIPAETEAFILPMFLYLSFSNIFSIGFFATFVSLGSAIFMMLVGKYSDKIGKRKFMRIGSIFMLTIWLGFYFATKQEVFFILSLLSGFLGALISIPFKSIFYINAKNNHVEDFVIFREIPIAIGRVLLFSFGLLFVTKVKLIFLFSLLPYLFMMFF